MPNLDLIALSLADLKQLQKNVAKTISGFEDRKKSEARALVEAQAKELGFTLAELVGGPIAKTRASARPKYRHPENPEITWSGRGRKPRWFSGAIAAGKSPDSMAV